MEQTGQQLYENIDGHRIAYQPPELPLGDLRRLPITICGLYTLQPGEIFHLQEATPFVEHQ